MSFVFAVTGLTAITLGQLRQLRDLEAPRLAHAVLLNRPLDVAGVEFGELRRFIQGDSAERAGFEIDDLKGGHGINPLISI
jgi:hypothetical protein